MSVCAHVFSAFASDEADAAADQRVFTHAQVQLDAERSLHVHLLNAQLSFSPNGTLQRQQIEQLVNYAADLSGPVILTADMQLFADGRSTDGEAPSAWPALEAGGFTSATPVCTSATCAGSRDNSSFFTNDDAAITTVDFGSAAGGARKQGVQQDYIWFRGNGTLELARGDPQLPSKLAQGWAVCPAELCEHCVVPSHLENNLGLGHWGVEGGVACSYHRPVLAAFRMV